MNFLKRLGFYLIGFSISLIIVAYFFKEKGTEFCYLPNCRTLKEIRSKKLLIAPELQIKFPSDSIAKNQIKFFLHNGEVDFFNSDKHPKPCKTYLINLESQQLTIESCDSIAIAKSLKTKEN